MMGFSLPKAGNGSTAGALLEGVLAFTITPFWWLSYQASRPLHWLLMRFQRTAAMLTPAADPVGLISQVAIAHPKTKGDLLVHDKRAEFAERAVPRAKFPWMWTEIPADIERSIVADGRLVNGGPVAPALAGNGVDEAVVIDAYNHAHSLSVRAGMTAWFAATLLLINSVMWPLMMDLWHQFRGAGAGAAEVRMTMQTYLASYGDVWNDAEARTALEYVPNWLAASIGSIVGKLMFGVVALVAAVVVGAFGLVVAAPLGWAIAKLTFIGALRSEVHNAAGEAVKHLKKPYREALQRWRQRQFDREVEMRAYAEQVKFASELDHSPILSLGVTEGVAIGHGRLGAPAKGTPLRMSLLDLTQHVCVTGGSGEGKSRYFYRPLAKQLLQLRKAGYPVAIYATDDKAVIGREIAAMAREMDFADEEIIEIGTGPGDWRVDLLDGISPQEFSEIVQNASKASQGDDFWTEMGSDHSRNILSVLQAAERSEEGQAWVRENGIRLYSIMSLVQSITNPDKLNSEIQWALKAVRSEYSALHGIHIETLLNSIDYLVNKAMPMVAATKDGVEINARKALNKFTQKPELTRGFADGAGDHLLPLRLIRSNTIRTINISQVEHGSAGRLLLVLLKAQLFKLARQEEQADPEAAAEKLNWWFNCDMADPLKDQAYLDIFLADEYQAQAIAGSDGSGISDGTVWNVLRSARIAGVILTQSRKAFDQAMGEVAASNMLLNFRTRIFMRTEDTSTIREVKELGGKAPRYQVADWNHFESMEAVKRELGADPDRLRAAKFEVAGAAKSAVEMGFIWRMKKLASAHYQVDSYDDPYSFDDRFTTGEGPAGTNAQAAIQSEQAATWRHEDRNTAAMQHLGSEADVFTDNLVMQMGRGRAVCFVQRAGLTQVDVARLAAPADYLADEATTV